MNVFLFTGVLLVVAIYAGRFFKRLKFPAVTGYILIGFLLGNIPLLSNSLNPYFSKVAIYVDEFALAVISFEMGMEFRIRNLLEIEKNIFIITITQAVFTYAVIFAGFRYLLHVPLQISLLVASIGVATAPDVVVLILRETGRNSKITKYLEGIVTLDDLLAEIAFILTLPLVEKSGNALHAETSVVFLILREFVLAIVFAFLLGMLFTLISKEFHRLRALFSMTIGTVFIAIGIGIFFKIHIIFLLLLTGIIYTNITNKQNTTFEILGQLDAPLFILFLIVNGSALSLKILFASGVLGIGFIALRGTGKVIGGYISKFFTKDSVSDRIGWALLPQSEISIYLAILAKSAIPKFGDSVFAVAMSGVIFFEIIGIPVLKYILSKEKQFANSKKG